MTSGPLQSVEKLSFCGPFDTLMALSVFEGLTQNPETIVKRTWTLRSSRRMTSNGFLGLLVLYARVLQIYLLGFFRGYESTI
jgi:hypothetical protein